MGWTLVVSESETFQREAISRLRDERPVVGATGSESARSLVRAVDVEEILVDSRDQVGRDFLATLRNLPRKSLPGVRVVVVGPSDPTFATTPSLDEALPASAPATAA